MNKYIPQSKLKEILDKASANKLQPDLVVEDLVNKGYQIEGLNDPKPIEKERGLFGKALDYATAPGEVLHGLTQKGIRGASNVVLGALGKEERIQPFQEERELKENILRVGDTAPIVGGLIGSSFGPAGTFAGTAIGQGVNDFTENITGESEPEMLKETVKGVSTGAIAAAGDKLFRVAGYGIKKAAGFTDDIYRSIVAPKTTTKVLQAAARKNHLTGNTLTGFNIADDVHTKALIETAKGIDGFSNIKGIPNNIKIVHKSIESLSDDLASRLAFIDDVIPVEKVSSSFSKAAKEISEEFGDDVVTKQMEGLSRIWEKSVEEAAGEQVELTATQLWKARKLFDKRLAERFTEKIFQPTRENARSEAVRVFRHMVNDTIEESAKKQGTSFKLYMDEISNMYDIVGNLSSKIDQKAARGIIGNAKKLAIGTAGAGAAGATAATILNK